MVNWRGRNSASSVTNITDHVVLFIFFISYFLLIVAGCGKVFMIGKVEYEELQVSGTLEA